jgi:hypothetical protein
MADKARSIALSVSRRFRRVRWDRKLTFQRLGADHRMFRLKINVTTQLIITDALTLVGVVWQRWPSPSLRMVSIVGTKRRAEALVHSETTFNSFSPDDFSL